MASGLDIAGVAISAVELVVEFVFCYFVWREFKMTKQSFEWMEAEQKEKREKDIAKKIHFFAWCAVRGFTNIYKASLEKHDIRMLKSMIAEDKETIKKICEYIAKETFLPQSFCEEVIKLSITSIREQLIGKDIDYILSKDIDYILIYKCLDETAKNIFTKNTLTPISIEQIKIYFNSIEEIDEIYEKLTNIKL